MKSRALLLVREVNGYLDLLIQDNEVLQYL
jgi:hypothetical protein